MNNTTKEEAAQMIAEKIDSASEIEIEAMIKISSEIYGENLLPLVSNLYAKINPSVMKCGVKVGY